MNEDQNTLPVEGRECFEYEPSTRMWKYVTLFGGVALGFLIAAIEDGEVSWGLFLILFLVKGIFVLIIEFSHRFAKDMRVSFDFEQRIVVLEGVFYPQSFWDVFSKKYVEIPFDDFVGVVNGSSRNGRSHFVYTKESRLNVGEYFENYDLMIDLFREISKDSDGVPLRRNIWVWSIVASLVGVAIVFVLGWLLGWI